jgi:hypothetical protein
MSSKIVDCITRTTSHVNSGRDHSIIAGIVVIVRFCCVINVSTDVIHIIEIVIFIVITQFAV